MALCRWLAWIVVVAVLGGCGGVRHGAGSDDGDRLHEQARQALARYDQALSNAGGAPALGVVGDLTGQLGDWEATNGENKAALLSGQVIATTALPPAPRPTGQVVWANGATRAYPLISAEEALRQLVKAGSGDCHGCQPLRDTGARLSTAAIQNIRGPATATDWEIAL